MNLKKRFKAIYSAIRYGMLPLPDAPAGKVVIVETDTDQLCEALGIPEDRFKILMEVSQKSFENLNDTSQMLRDISGACNHANELALCSYILGHAITKREYESKTVSIFN